MISSKMTKMNPTEVRTKMRGNKNKKEKVNKIKLKAHKKKEKANR